MQPLFRGLAEIEKKFRSFFGGIDDRKKFFWDFLTINAILLLQTYQQLFSGAYDSF